VKHPRHQDFVKPLRAAKQPRGEPLDAILEPAPTVREIILAERLHDIYLRLSTLRSRTVPYRMTDKEERDLETLLSRGVDALWFAHPEPSDSPRQPPAALRKKGGKP
jgi:hypothetical protein